jgi:hypothetical protein
MATVMSPIVQAMIMMSSENGVHLSPKRLATQPPMTVGGEPPDCTTPRLGNNQWFLEPFSAFYRFSGGTVLILAENWACTTGSIGRCFTL